MKFQIRFYRVQTIKIEAVKLNNHSEIFPLLHENLSLVINNRLLLSFRNLCLFYVFPHPLHNHFSTIVQNKKTEKKRIIIRKTTHQTPPPLPTKL